MKKLRSIDEYGRGKALERYSKPEPQTKYGHSGMGQNLRGKFQFARGGNITIKTDYGDPVGSPGDTDMDFEHMDRENRAVTKKAR